MATKPSKHKQKNNKPTNFFETKPFPFKKKQVLLRFKPRNWAIIGAFSFSSLQTKGAGDATKFQFIMSQYINGLYKSNF